MRTLTFSCLSLFISLLFTSGCGSGGSKTPQTLPLNRSIAMRVGESRRIEGQQAELRLTRVVHDTRCAVGERCIVPGWVTAQFALMKGNTIEREFLVSEGPDPHGEIVAHLEIEPGQPPLRLTIGMVQPERPDTRPLLPQDQYLVPVYLEVE